VVEGEAYALLKKVRLTGKEDAYPGQQQRVAIARLLARDEAQLDAVRRGHRRARSGDGEGGTGDHPQLAEEGMTCILVTHEMGFAREVANHIVEHRPPAEFFSAPRDPRSQEFLGQVL
jgi:polar amino acid transport system ATP-binding protein